MHLGEYGQAQALYRESLALYRRQGDHWGEALALNNVAFAAFALADLSTAQALFAESLALFRQLGDDEGSATVIEALSWIGLATGRPRQAAILAGAADAHRRRLGTTLYGLDLAHHRQTMAELRASLAIIPNAVTDPHTAHTAIDCNQAHRWRLKLRPTDHGRTAGTPPLNQEDFMTTNCLP